MKRIILLFIFAACFQVSFTQDVVYDDIFDLADYHAKIEIRGINHVYRVDTVSFMGMTSCSVIRKDSVFTSMPNDIGPERYQLRLDSYETLCRIVGKNLSQKINIQAATSKNDDLSLILHSDMSGAITEVTFIYQSFLRIPIPLLENIEEEIKKQCRVLIDHQSPALKNASYVDYSTTVFLRKACN